MKRCRYNRAALYPTMIIPTIPKKLLTLHLKISVLCMQSKASQWWCFRNMRLYLISEIILEIQLIIKRDRKADANIFILCFREILCFTAELARGTANEVIVYIP